MPFQPVAHPRTRGIQIMGRDGLAFAADAMHRDDAATFLEEPKDTRIEFANVPKLKEPAAESLGQRFAVILPVAQLCQAGRDGGEVICIAGFEFQKKILDRGFPGFGFVELYVKSILRLHQIWRNDADGMGRESAEMGAVKFGRVCSSGG